MGLVKEEELELGAGSLGLGFGTVAGGSKSSLQLQWQGGGDGSLLSSSRLKLEQGGMDGNGGRGGFINTSGLLISSWYTQDQWRELQRQAMIYKHMAASVPIPADLLRGLWPAQSMVDDAVQIPAAAAALCANRTGGAGYHGGHASGAGATADPEPRRCRRTDGKKWRCANEAAEGKRYCEKHLHRSRPRSRKPVERQQQQLAPPPPSTQQQQQLMPPHASEVGMTARSQEYSQVERKPAFCPPPPAPTRQGGAGPVTGKNEISSWNMDYKKVKSDETVNSVSSLKVKSEEMMRQLGHHAKLKLEQQWRPQLQQTPLVQLQLHQQQQQQQQDDEKTSQAQQHHYHQLDQNYYSYGPSTYQQDDSFFSLLNSDITSLNERHLSFADPWSSSTTGSLAPTSEPNNYIDFSRSNDPDSSHNNNSISSAAATPRSPPLSLVPGTADEGQLVSMGLPCAGGDTKPPPFWWLADALLTGSSPDLHAVGGASAAASHPTTDEEGGGGGVVVSSPPDSSVASPSGVLQRPLASISDCSSNNSSEAFGGLGGGGGGAETTAGLHTWMMKP